MKNNYLVKLSLLCVGFSFAVFPTYALKFEIPKELQGQANQEAAAKAEDTSSESVAVTKSNSEVNTTDAIAGDMAAKDDQLNSETGRIVGRVVDKDTGSPVRGVAVLLEGTDAGTVTGQNGEYRIESAATGIYTLSFIKSGYIESNVTGYEVVGGEEQEFAFALPPRPAEMSDDVYELQDFSVTAEEANQLMLKLDLKMNSSNLLSSLSSEDFSKYAASDLGDAIKRVSGVSVVGGKYAVIRGLGDRYVNSSLNGLPVASPDPDRQAVQLDLFPSGLFDALEVTKTFTPDQSANSTGGIDMKIKELPKEFFATLSLGVGGHSVATGNDDFLTSGRVVSGDRWANGSDERSLPKVATQFPDALNAPVFPIPGILPGPPFVSQAEKDLAVAEAVRITDTLGRHMHAFGDAPELDQSFKFSAGNSGFFYDDRLRFGVIGGINYSRKARMIEDANYFRRATELSGTKRLSPETFVDSNAGGKYENKKWTESTLTSAFSWLFGLGIELDEKHSIRAHRLDLKIAEDQVMRYWGEVYNEFAGDLGYSEDLVQEYSEIIHYQERRLISDQLIGSHLFEFPADFLWDDFLVGWGYSKEEASQDEPGFIQTRALLYGDNLMFTLTQNPSSPTEPETQFAIWRKIKEDRDSKKIDFTLQRVKDGDFESKFKFGLLTSEGNRNVLDEFVSFKGTNLSTPVNGVEIIPGDLDSAPFENFDDLQASGYELSANVDLFTESDGQYLMLDQKLFDKFRFIGGYRYEKNSADVQVNGELKLRGAGSSNPLADLPTDGGYDEGGWYPGMSFIYSPTDSLQFRVAYSNTIALPSAREVSPYASSSFQGSDIDVGNPELLPSNVANIDLGVSYRDENGDSLSVTFFRKKVEARIEKLTGLGSTTFIPVHDDDTYNLDNYPELFLRSQNILGGATLLSWYNNPDEARLLGIEIDGRKNLGFISSSLDRFSFGGNFTYIEGEVDRFPIEIAAKKAVERPVGKSRGLTDQPESIFNFDLTYDNPDLGLRVSLVYYHISDVLEHVSLADSYDFYSKSYDQIDLTLSKNFGDNFKFSFSAKNIANSLRETFYDMEGYEVEGDSYRMGTSFSLSGSYKF